jgi:hypothetical protein
VSAPPPIRPFLEHGFLPENLPPAVTSRQLWPTYENRTSTYNITREAVGQPTHYSASKRGGQRRLFSINHPSFACDQAIFFNRHWNDLEAVLMGSPGSLSKPKFLLNGPRAIRITAHSELPKARLKAFSRYRFCAVTDVSRCYPSIYTHSVPWAVNGHAVAKADRRVASAAVFGNRLDFVLRQAQDAQTIGIAVGPDTSRLVGEIILSAVDRAFLSRYASKSNRCVSR